MNRSGALAVLTLPWCLCAQPVVADDRCSQSVPVEVTFPSELGDVTFPHELHTDMEIPCEDCHHETLAGSLSMPHPEYFEDFWIRCETCHHVAAEPGCPQSCSACHHGSPASFADETLSSKVVIHRSCWECHPTSTGSEASRGCKLCHQRDARSESE